MLEAGSARNCQGRHITATAEFASTFEFHSGEDGIEQPVVTGNIGDEISFIDYAGTFDSNALTIDQNGSEKIAGSKFIRHVLRNMMADKRIKLSAKNVRALLK